MRQFRFAMLAACFCCIALPAGSQTKPPPKPAASPAAPADTIRYLTFSGVEMNGLQVDGVIRETRQKGKTVNAEADLCYPVGGVSRRYERAVGALKIAGDQFSGVLNEQTGGGSVELTYKIKAAGNDLTLDGSLKRKDRLDRFSTSAFASPQKEFESNRNPKEGVVTAFDFSKTFAANQIVVSVRPSAIPAVLEAARSSTTEIDAWALMPDCTSLRNDYKQIAIKIDPLRAAELVARLSGVSGVHAAGWQEGSPSNSAVRVKFDSALLAAGKPDARKIVEAAAPVIARALGARYESAGARDPLSGEQRLVFIKASDLLPNSILTEQITVPVLLIDDPSVPGGAFVEVLSVLYKFTDVAPGSKLVIAEPSAGGEEGEPPAGALQPSALAMALAREWKGQVWEGEGDAAKWTPVK